MANKNIFNSIQLKKPKKNVFDLTHDVKLSTELGMLTPIMCTECVPGDKFNISCESLVRFAPLVSPTMHRFDVSMHYFFVPNRIIWDGWEDWITQNDPLLELPYLLLAENSTTATGSLADYLGLPCNASGGNGSLGKISALPFAAYQAIYAEYYRDQNLITEFDYHLPSGEYLGDIAELCALRRRAWEHDYFTAALPFAQKGAAVEIPLGNVAVNSNLGPDTTTMTGTPYDAIIDVTEEFVDGVPPGHMFVQPTSINDLRRAFRLQEWLEKNARAGTRYVENILAHFGVKSSDARLNRPEYITGTKSPVVISEVLNTTGTDDLPQGNMAGHAVGITSGQYGSYFCEEHGYIIGIMSILPKTAYQNGVPKHFLKTEDPFQYYWPTFAHIGEQEVINREIYCASDQVAPGATFGYVPRYAEYRYQPSRVAGDFRTTLDTWHFGRKFVGGAAQPALNKDFVECNPGKRIFAVTNPAIDSIYAHVLNKVTAVRPMPKFGTPAL